MSEFLGIDIKTLDDVGFQFFQTGLIRKVLEAIGMEHSNGLPIPTLHDALPISGRDVYGINTIPLSLVSWRYRNILFAAVLCDTLVLCVNRAHW